MDEPSGVPSEILTQVRTICLALPDTHEEPAWVGRRWRVRTTTFAHVFHVEAGWPPVCARLIGSDGPADVLSFRSGGDELDALRHAGPPFVGPAFGRDDMLLVLGHDLDWQEVTELVTESYCRLAPARLVALVDRPGG